jgi:uracil-DNA glycosylase family 4
MTQRRPPPPRRTLDQRIIACRRCPRLRSYCREVARRKRASYLAWEYWGRPVPNFGDPAGRLLVIGLAPAAHGANRTGRMFTGDRSGAWLYRALYRFGFASHPHAESRDDRLLLQDCLVTAVCHCAPPDNRPAPAEIAHCRSWLDETIDGARRTVIVALGQIAWRAAVSLAQARGWHSGPSVRFAHGARLPLSGGRTLLASYHPSQQNTFTGRLTTNMFDAVFRQARRLLDGGDERLAGDAAALPDPACTAGRQRKVPRGSQGRATRPRT